MSNQVPNELNLDIDELLRRGDVARYSYEIPIEEALKLGIPDSNHDPLDELVGSVVGKDG